MMNVCRRNFCFFLALIAVFAGFEPAWANVPGGGTNGASVTYTDNGNGTVTLANGIITIVVTTADASIHTINYTFNNTGSSQTVNLLSGGNNGGVLYWTGNPSSFGTMSFTESVVTNTTNCVEIALLSNSASNGTMEVHFALLRGASGFYSAIVLNHRSQDANVGIVLRPNIYAGSMFNWMSVDAARSRVMEVSGGSSIGVQGAPKEVSLWTNGIHAGQYEDKYKYSAELGKTHVWGWSSVGTGGKNVGLWNVSASVECYPGGPMERSLMEHIGTTILNVFTGGYYGLATDNNIPSGETWSKVYGPYFYYCNNVTNTLTGTNAPAQALYADAQAQAVAEATAWPYSWFSNTNYVPATNRGSVTGKIVIADSGNPNASASGLWVGVVQQPSASDTVYDFQEWCRPYEFWVQTDTNGNFTIPNVIAQTNYTLYAFGPGASGTFMSQTQTGGNPPLLYDLPATPFSITVAAKATNNLGTVTWTPTRVGATVFEIGYPDRTAAKFRHGDDYWVGDIGPGANTPSPVWSKWLEYQFDFPNGVNYTVGQSRWSTDWNFIQPVVPDSQGVYNPTTSTITFNLATAPTNGATASLYLGLCSDYYAAVIITVNGVNMSSVSGLSASPNSNIPSSGFYVTYASSDGNIREGNNGAFSDERLTFSASALHAGSNTITISFRTVAASYFADHFMYDYLRLELTGYVPPAPANATAYAGNNCNLVTWPVVPGATSYNILRSTTSGSGYASVTNGVTGPVCGSGAVNGAWLDTTAANGTTYYYVVRSVNPTGSSTNSAPSAGATPSASVATTAPEAPTGLTLASTAHQSVTLSWTAAPGANVYSVWRSTLFDNSGGASNVLSSILLNNAVTNPTYTDTTPTDGCIYRYWVTATGAGGTSPNSALAVGVPLPTAPTTVPVSLTASFVATTNITLNWTAVPGAVGYVISRATSAAGPFTYLQTITETTYTDWGLNPNLVYYYRVAAMNAAGTSANNTDAVNSQQVFPVSLTATATNEQITLTWPAPTGATNYTVKRGTTSGSETVTVVTGYPNTTYTNTGLVNGTTYYYVVTATGVGGTSGNSPEASATPLANGSGLWISPANGDWSATTNWSGGGIATGVGSSADFSGLSLSSNLTVTLDSARSINGLIFGDLGSTYHWTLAGTNTLTLGASPSVNVVNESALISVPLAGAAGVTKTGAGLLTLGGATNTLTGGLVVNVGTVALDYSVANSPVTNLLPVANSLTSAGGGLQIIGSSSVVSTQTFAATVLNAGESTVSAAPTSGANLPVLNLGTVTAMAGGVVEFIGPATVGAGGTNVPANALITTPVIGNNAFIGGNGTAFFNANYATVGLYDLAATTGAASPYTVVGGSQIPGFYTAVSGTVAGAANLDVIGNVTGWSSQPYLTSMRFNTSQGANLSVAATGNGSTLTLSDILVTPAVGAYNVTFNNGNLRPAGGSTSYAGPIVIWQNNTAGELILNSMLANSKAGAAAYVQAGPGTVFIAGTASGYAGQSYLDDGVTLIAGNGSIGAAASGMAVNLNGGTLAANSTFSLDNAGSALRTVNILSTGGGLAATAGNTFTVGGFIGSSATSGPLTIGIPALSANNNIAGLLPGTGSGTANAAVYATGTVMLTNGNYYTGGTVLQSGTLNINGLFALGGANYGGVTFNGGTLQYATSFSGNNGPSDLTAIGTAGVTLAAGGGTIDLNGNTVTFANAIGHGGPGALTVKSSVTGGSLTLLGANSYSGTTTVTNATLWVANASGSATGTGNVLVQNRGVLSGDGAVAGSVTIAAGGMLTPGNGSNTLTIGSNLTLNSGSTVVLAVQHLPLTNSAVTVGNNLLLGGSLVVTNLGGTLANGDSFPLFAATTMSGTFSTLTLPTLASGLMWDTNTFLTTGTLTVTTVGSPIISNVSATGGNLSFTGTGGVANANYYLLSTTNLTTPAASWTRLSTNQFDASGAFSLQLTNVLNSVQPQTFYRVQLQ